MVELTARQRGRAAGQFARRARSLLWATAWKTLRRRVKPLWMPCRRTSPTRAASCPASSSSPMPATTRSGAKPSNWTCGLMPTSWFSQRHGHRQRLSGRRAAGRCHPEAPASVSNRAVRAAALDRASFPSMTRSPASRWSASRLTRRLAGPGQADSAGRARRPRHRLCRRRHLQRRPAASGSATSRPARRCQAVAATRAAVRNRVDA